MYSSHTNPFTPMFGSMPSVLIGRTEFIDDVIGGLLNRPGDPNRATIFIGPRGSGKTVLIQTILREAEELGWIGVYMPANRGMLENIVWQVRGKASHLIGIAQRSDVTSVNLGLVGIGREMCNRQQPAWFELQDIVEELNQQGTGLLLCIDEVDAGKEDLIELVSMFQMFIGDNRDIALIMAGLPSKVSQLLLDDSVSFVRRAFQRALGPIPLFEVEEALQETIASNGRAINEDALALAAEGTNGFAYAIQLVGYYLWRQGEPDSVLTFADAQRAIERARKEMERSVFLPMLAELRPREQEYLEAMAVDEGPSVTSDIAARMGISMTNASNLRRRLIEHGAIHEVRMGVVDFEMPMLREYLSGR